MFVIIITLAVFIVLSIGLYDVPVSFLRLKPQGQQTFLNLLNVDLLTVLMCSSIYQMTLYQI